MATSRTSWIGPTQFCGVRMGLPRYWFHTRSELNRFSGIEYLSLLLGKLTTQIRQTKMATVNNFESDDLVCWASCRVVELNQFIIIGHKMGILHLT